MEDEPRGAVVSDPQEVGGDEWNWWLVRLANAGEIAWIDYGIVQTLLVDAPSDGAMEIRRTIASLGKAMNKTEPTIRAGVKRLEKAGVLTHERDRTIPGSPYVFTLHRRIRLVPRVDEPGGLP